MLLPDKLPRGTTSSICFHDHAVLLQVSSLKRSELVGMAPLRETSRLLESSLLLKPLSSVSSGSATLSASESSQSVWLSYMSLLLPNLIKHEQKGPPFSKNCRATQARSLTRVRSSLFASHGSRSASPSLVLFSCHTLSHSVSAFSQCFQRPL